MGARVLILVWEALYPLSHLLSPNQSKTIAGMFLKPLATQSTSFEMALGKTMTQGDEMGLSHAWLKYLPDKVMEVSRPRSKGGAHLTHISCWPVDTIP